MHSKSTPREARPKAKEKAVARAVKAERAERVVKEETQVERAVNGRTPHLQDAQVKTSYAFDVGGRGTWLRTAIAVTPK